MMCDMTSTTIGPFSVKNHRGARKMVAQGEHSSFVASAKCTCVQVGQIVSWNIMVFSIVNTFLPLYSLDFKRH